jgi:hypothetical protein
MTLQELLEHAHLDALGQLDEREQAAFEAAFAVAPPSIKAQIRREQERWAPMEHLLPPVEPSPELRERVLDAVTAAMVAQGAGELSIRPSQRVAAAWRTSSIGLITAVLVMGAALVYITGSERESTRHQNEALPIDLAGTSFRSEFRSALMDKDTHVQYFASNDPAFTGRGSFWTNPDWKQSHLFLELARSNAGEEYRVVTVVDGEIGDVLERFESTGVLHGGTIDQKLPKGTQIAVIAAVKNELGNLNHVLLTVTI